jgi:hypothetical protein
MSVRFLNPDASNELSEGLLHRGSTPIPMFVSIPIKNVGTALGFLP